MQQDGQHEPPKNHPDPWRLTLGKAAFGMVLFVLSYTASVGYLTWYEIREYTSDSWQGTVNAIVKGAVSVGLTAVALAVTAVVGTKIFRAMTSHLRRG